MSETTLQRVPVQGRTGVEPFFFLSAFLILFGVSGAIAQPRLQWPDSVWTISVAFLVMGLVGLITADGISRPPSNGPAQYLELRRKQQQSGKKVLVCLGDSLTHGRCSDNWVDRITRDPQLQDAPLHVVNAGQNNLCTHTVLTERVDHVKACQPDFVFVLIGSNDVMCIYRKDWARDKIKMWDLPERPTLQVVQRNLDGIMENLVSNTKAKIGLATLPPMGEDFTSPPNDLIRKVNAIVHKAGHRYGDTKRVTVLDVHERFKAEITAKRAGSNKKIHSADDFLLAAIPMSVLHCVMGISWKVLSRVITGNTIMSDSLHLNEDGGDIIVDIVAKWLIENGVAPPN